MKETFEIGTVVRVKDGISPNRFEGCEGIVVGSNDKICLNIFVKIIKDKQGNKYQEADFRDRELEVIKGVD